MKDVNKKKGLMINMDAGKSLRILMARHEMTRDQVSEYMGLSTVTVSGLRRNRFMKGEHLQQLSDLFGISPSDFIRIGESDQ